MYVNDLSMMEKIRSIKKIKQINDSHKRLREAANSYWVERINLTNDFFNRFKEAQTDISNQDFHI